MWKGRLRGRDGRCYKGVKSLFCWGEVGEGFGEEIGGKGVVCVGGDDERGWRGMGGMEEEKKDDDGNPGLKTGGSSQDLLEIIDVAITSFFKIFESGSK